MNFERLSEYKYRIPREDKMGVDAAFYASEKILADLEAEDFASLKQLRNVATLPGIVEPALTMPDIHWGYGFPIGGGAAFDPPSGGGGGPLGDGQGPNGSAVEQRRGRGGARRGGRPSRGEGARGRGGPRPHRVGRQ